MVQRIDLSSRAEWLAKRKSYIGGSEAACVVGANPFMTNVDLWELKTGRRKAEDISGNPYVRYGTEAERPLRELFALDFPQYKVEYTEHNIWLNSDYPFAHASLDGWLTDKQGRRGIFECKTTNINSAAQRQKWAGRIPDNYFCQLLHYFFVTGFDFAVLKAQQKFEYENEVELKTKHYFIERYEVEDDIQCLIEAEMTFCGYLVRDERPPLILPRI